jgi:UDP-N-acetylglucosamine 2-epimerase (non-hydrolysing)
MFNDVLVVGDVNSTIACRLVAVKLNAELAHVEAGLRTFD